MMKNLAGNDVSIFLFRFDLLNNGITFVLNEGISEDMYPEIEEQVQPLAQACSETLLRYKHLCNGDTIMDGNILTDECFEVMLFKGIGSHFREREKQNLFDDAQEIANLLIEVMTRRSKESEQDIHHVPQPITPKIKRTGVTDKAFEELGERQNLFDDQLYDHINPELKRLKPEDLPKGVTAKRSYDHRGHCLAFFHDKHGELGKIVLSGTSDGESLLEAELSKENPENLKKKQKVFEKVISIVETGLNPKSSLIIKNLYTACMK